MVPWSDQINIQIRVVGGLEQASSKGYERCEMTMEGRVQHVKDFSRIS